jgi:hypothetical protein
MTLRELTAAVPFQGWVFLAAFWAMILSTLAVVIAPGRAHRRPIASGIGLAIIICSWPVWYLFGIASEAVLACGIAVSIAATWWPTRPTR